MSDALLGLLIALTLAGVAYVGIEIVNFGTLAFVEQLNLP